MSSHDLPKNEIQTCASQVDPSLWGAGVVSGASWTSACKDLLLIIEVLHDLMYHNSRNYGSTVYVIGTCRISIINSSTSARQFVTKEATNVFNPINSCLRCLHSWLSCGTAFPDSCRSISSRTWMAWPHEAEGRAESNEATLANALNLGGYITRHWCCVIPAIRDCKP